MSTTAAVTPASTTWATEIPSPVGSLTVRGSDTADGFAVTGLWMPVHRHGPAPSDVEAWHRDGGPFAAVADQLAQYFAGEREEFDLLLAAAGTPFQQRVWAALRAIPYAETRSYVDVAVSLGAPTAVRAVGAANGRNPISIVVPCHRVVGADGSMTGYGGGIENKRWLLAHERTVAGDALF